MALLLVGCGSATAGDPLRGATLFDTQACGTCHQLANRLSATGRIGPDLSQIGLLAETRVSGQTAERYLDTSLIFPNAFLAPGYPPNVMPLDYGQSLTPQARRDLVAFLRSLR